VKTRIKTLPPIIALALLAALATTWLSSIGPAWAESPISVLSPLLPPRPGSFNWASIASTQAPGSPGSASG